MNMKQHYGALVAPREDKERKRKEKGFQNTYLRIGFLTQVTFMRLSTEVRRGLVALQPVLV